VESNHVEPAQTALAVVDDVAQRVFLAWAGRELLLRDLMELPVAQARMQAGRALSISQAS
jgi:hypothetical protein